jgi:hypothetical protein
MYAGCFDSSALNFDSMATVAGECVHTIYGCMIKDADNHREDANVQSGAPRYPPSRA